MAEEYSVGSGKVSKALKVCLPMKKKDGFGKPIGREMEKSSFRCANL